MRFGALSLLRYGHFTDREIELLRGEHDLHVIHGPNEAGKSTCQSAVGDLLFGIPHLTAFSFLHGNKDLRIGAALEHAGETRRVSRRKGNKDTLLDQTGNPIAETVLAPFLGSADRPFFERMFSLNHRRLEEGGREILAAEGRVGQTLFAAGAGLSGLHQVLQQLDAEADALWAPRHSKRRAYHAAEDRLKEARQRLKEAAVPVKHWKELSRTVETIRVAQDTARAALTDANRRKARVERIRRVLPHLTVLRQYQLELAALGEVFPMPEDAPERLRQAEDARTREQTRLDGLARQLAEARENIAGIVPDEAMLRFEETIDALAQECGLVEQVRRKLPRQEAELEAAHREVRRLACDLGWEGAEGCVVLARLPARVHRDHLQAWLEAHEKSRRNRDEARTRQDELEREVATIAGALQTLGTAGNGDDLAAALRDARRLGNADEQMAEMRARRERLAWDLEQGGAGLSGWDGSPADLAAMRVPSRAAIEAHHDALDALTKRLDGIARQREADEARLESLRLDHEHAVRDERAIPREALAAARRGRDDHWSRIRARWLERAAPEAAAPADETLAEHFSAALSEADELADRRFDNAEAAAALVKIERDIERAQTAIAQGERRRQEAAAERKRLQAKWLAAWCDTGVTPDAPRSMLDWLDRRARLLDLRGDLGELDCRIEALQGQVSVSRDRVLSALGALGAPGVTGSASFAAVLEHASKALDQVMEARERRRHLRVQQQQAGDRLAHAMEQAKGASEAYERWREDFSAALAACGLDCSLGPDAAKGALHTLRELAEQAGAVERLAEDIAQSTGQVLKAFGDRAGQLFQDLGTAPGDKELVRAVRMLHRRLTEEREARLKRRGEEQRIERMEEDLKTAREALEQAEVRIAQLCGSAGAKDVTGLNESIRRDARARSLRQSIEAAKNTALQAGDGKSLEDLQAEAADAEADQLAVDVGVLDQEIVEHTQTLTDLSADLRTAESELKQLDGAETAAIAESQRQQALTDMGEAASGYAWKRGAAILLRWSLDRYRREKQGPLLSRAGELFRVLTLGSFDHLEVDFDEQDRLELTGLRSGGERVRVSGMSDGTADQLYFALRVAAIEEYLDKAPGLPFVADDLFINFDDARAIAGLEILAALSRRTQVLFFTHHAHLVELAERALSGRAQVVEL